MSKKPKREPPVGIDPVHDPVYSLTLTEGDVQDLAAGIVNTSVRAMTMWLLEDLDARLRMNASRPVHGAVVNSRDV